jgi:hypothetical protein
MLARSIYIKNPEIAQKKFRNLGGVQNGGRGRVLTPVPDNCRVQSASERLKRVVQGSKHLKVSKVPGLD